MMSLTFYGGVNEIGRNKILLEDKDTKIFLDFGMRFGKNGAYDKFMKPRSTAGIKDCIEMGLVPELQGLYRDDLMEMNGSKLVAPDIDAKTLFPVHTEHPEMFRKVSDNRILIEEGKKYTI